MRTVIIGIFLALALAGVIGNLKDDHARNMAHAATIPLTSIDPTNKQFIAALDVARVFGRSAGCAEANPKLINDIAEEAVKVNLDPRILAATIAIESSCNQFAVSSHGAIGLMQITPRVWHGSYDIEHQYNLLNINDNIHVGAAILSGLVKQYGLSEGLRHYNGMGTASDAYDAGYVEKIMAMAAKR